MTDYVKEYLKKHPERCSGRTTRLIDFYIQELFTHGEVEIRDHEDHWSAHQNILHRVRKRLAAEHRHVRVKRVPTTSKIKLVQKEVSA